MPKLQAGLVTWALVAASKCFSSCASLLNCPARPGPVRADCSQDDPGLRTSVSISEDGDQSLRCRIRIGILSCTGKKHLFAWSLFPYPEALVTLRAETLKGWTQSLASRGFLYKPSKESNGFIPSRRPTRNRVRGRRRLGTHITLRSA